MSIPCPHCGSEKIRVSHSRNAIENKQQFTFRRRKKCSDCGKRHTTREVLESEWEDLSYLKNMNPTEISDALVLIKKASKLLSENNKRQH